MSTGTRGNALPEKIGHYKVVAELGRGGMGVVYKAHEESLNRFVAIKVLGDHLAADEQFLTRFTREARAAGAVSHPNVIPIYFIGQDDGRHYFAMEYVSGRSVQAMIRQEGRIGNPRAAQIILQAAQGLAAAHDRGVIHRDIKPANLMVDERGVVKIADFGIALPIEAQTRLTATGALMGTPGYLSPEHCMGETVDNRADIYALGVTYFEMLTGRMPFNAESPLALLRQILQEDPPDVTALNSEVDQNSRRILMKMIARDRNQRYQNCHELIAELEEYLASKNVRGVTANLTSRSTAIPGAASTPTVVTGGAPNLGPTVITSDASQVKTIVPGATSPMTAPSIAPAAAAVTAAGMAPFTQPATNPQGQVVAMPPPQQKKKSSFALIAAVAIIAIVVAMGAAGMIGYKFIKGGKFFGFGKEANQASVLPAAGDTSASQPAESRKPVSQSAVELANTNPNALNALTSTQAPPAETQGNASQTTASSQGGTAAVVTPSNDALVTKPRQQQNAGGESSSTQRIARQQQERTPAPAAARPSTVAFAVQGDAGLTGAVSDVLNSELSASGLKVVAADDLPATEGMGGAPAGVLMDRLRGTAGVLVVAKIEATGQRELRYMGRYDTAYGSRVTVTVYDVASGRPIGTRGSANIEYTQLNASREAEKAVAPLARKAAVAIQSR